MNFFDLFSDVPENLVVVSPEYTVLAATDAYLKVTMRNREDIVGKHFLKEAFPEKDIPYEQNPVKRALDQTLQSKTPMVMDVIRYDLAIPEEEGGGYKELYWETSYIPGLDPEGNVNYIIQKAVNVTERELAKRLQKETESKFRIMTNMIPQLIYTNDAEGKVTYLNERWERYTGLSAAEVMGTEQGWLLAVHPEDREEVLKKAQDNFRAGTEFQVELRIRDKDGNYRWFLSKNAPVKMEGKDEIIMWVGSSTDVHSTKQMVQELLQANEQMSALADQVQTAFQTAENRRLTLERLIMQAPAIFAVTSGPEHRFELVNPHYQGLFPHRELLGRTVAEAVPEVIEQGFIKILDEVLQTKKPFVASEIPVVLDWDNSGKEEAHYFTTTYQPLMNGEEAIGIIVFCYEVT
jgi:PAS domain S-box-containing protein